MAADAPPTSYKKAPSVLDWDSLSEEDQFKQQEVMTKYIQELDTTQKFIEECKEIGREAASVEGDFRTVKNVFASFAAKYGDYFPVIRRVYVPRWDNLMARWSGNTGMLWSSRALAIRTADALTDYGRVLALIADIQTQSELEGAQSALRAYVEQHQISVGTQVTDGFKNLGIDLQYFSDDFAKFIGLNCPSSYAVSFEASIKSIKQCEEAIADLNEKIEKSALALGCSPVFGILSNIPVDSLGHYVVQRNEAQANLGKTKSNTTDVGGIIAMILALIAMRAEFEKFNPDIINICDKLGSFASIWAFATLQSIEINDALDEGMVVLTRKKFQSKLALLIAQIEPLREGLRDYAAQI